MGNCQTVDAAALVIQHPCGKLERMYWPLTASEVMKTNPGHYVSLIIPLPPPAAADHSDDNNRTVRFTRVKLLRPTDTLVLGRAYRLVTTQEVVKVLRAKKHAKMKRNVPEPPLQNQSTASDSENDQDNIQGTRSERNGQRPPGSTSSIGGGRPKSWRPSLQSISETNL